MSTAQQTKEIYNSIAPEFDLYRVKVWPCVKKFLSNLNNTHMILDIGCGNGKNIIGNPHLNIMGIDFSEKLVEICNDKRLNVTLANMTNIPYKDNTFDNIIAVASYHHLDNDTDRKCALNEMYRILKNNGTGLITTWAMEQGDRSKFKFTKTDEIVLWKSPNNITYNRYYHIYRKGELKEEINRLEPRFDVIDEYWEKGNWVITIQK
jgi:ubiquinone/menaquinone biosynthesis C-methylase UbiE